MAAAEGKEENVTKDDSQQKQCDHVMESDLSIAIDNLSLSSEWFMTTQQTTVLAHTLHLLHQIHTT